MASLLGNFTINQYCGLRIESSSVAVHYTVVYGQLPALRELHLADADGNGVTTQGERDVYVGGLAPGFADQLKLRVDGVVVPLHPVTWSSSLPTEQGGFSLRVDMDLAAPLPPEQGGNAPHRLQFANQNYPGRVGWHEIVVKNSSGVQVFDTNAFSNSLTGALSEALRSLPEAGPLDERDIHLVYTRGSPPVGAVLIAARAADPATAQAGTAGTTDTAGNARAAATGPADPAANTAIVGPANGTDSAWIERQTRRLIGMVSAPTLAPQVALLALLGALLLGAVHALSPGHGKTIVGAYLIGSRGTARHAAFLGLTVTITHTLGVFVLGFAALYASRFIVPERLFPILSLISALLVLIMGIVLMAQRAHAARQALSKHPGSQRMFQPVMQAAAASGRGILIAQRGAEVWHSHGGGPMHSHLPPGSAGEKITWRSLLTLGISGGLLPCPSAMVLLLAAVALNKTAYGMLLVVAFSLGLALTLTLIGMVFLYARNRLRPSHGASRWQQLLPILSAATITVLGIGLLFTAIKGF